MKKKFSKKPKKNDYAISLVTGEPIDVSNCIKVGEEVEFPKYDINKKIQKKLLKELPFEPITKKLFQKNNSQNGSITKQIKYSSGMVKSITKNENNEIINENIDYSNIKEAYLNNLKNNFNSELEILVNNIFLLYNREQIIRKIVRNPISTRALDEKILIWKYYIKDLSKEEKAHLIRKLLFYVGKFTTACYNQFMEIDEIKEANTLISRRKDKNKKEEDDKKEIINLIKQFHALNDIISCDKEGNPIKSNIPFHEENCKTLLFSRCILNMKKEFEGTGYGYTFLRELKNIGNMYTNASVIFDSVLHECYNIFDLNEFNSLEKIESYRILWNFYSDYFIDNCFVIKFMIQLKYLFGAYKQYDIVKFMHKLILVRFNTFEFLEKIKEQLVKIIGPEGELDNYKNIEKMTNIDDLLKYIEEDEDKKYKKKKKKRKNNLNNMINIK